MNLDQNALIQQAKQGDAHAFSELYAAIYKKLYQYALYTLGSPSDAEDAVSETVIDAFEGIKRLRSEDAFQTWIFKILQAKCRKILKDRYKKTETVPLFSEDDSSVAEYDFSPEETNSISRLLDRMTLTDLMKQLPPDDREILCLHLVFGYRSNEIAALLGINESTVRTREARALKKLRRLPL